MVKYAGTGKTAQLQSKRTIAQQELDLAFAAQQYVRGVPIAQITQLLNAQRSYKLSLATIFNMLGTVRDRWTAMYMSDYDAHRHKELARVDELERTYWELYLQSAKPTTETNVESETVDLPGATGIPTKKKASKKTVEHLPDVEALKGVERCITMRCRILGLNAPTKLDVSWRKQAEQAGYDPAMIIEGIVKNIVDSTPPDDLLDATKAEQYFGAKTGGSKFLTAKSGKRDYTGALVDSDTIGNDNNDYD